jgi:transcriptional regulator with XRE-family HTH domain
MKQSGIANAIRSARSRAGLTRAQLAEKAGIPRLTIWRIETGMTPDPRSDTLRRIATALGCTVDDLLREPEPKRPEAQRGYVDFDMALVLSISAVVAALIALIVWASVSNDTERRDAGVAAYEACVSVCRPAAVAEFRPARGDAAPVCHCRASVAENESAQ